MTVHELLSKFEDSAHINYYDENGDLVYERNVIESMNDPMISSLEVVGFGTNVVEIWGIDVELDITFARPEPSAHIQGLIESQKIDVN